MRRVQDKRRLTQQYRALKRRLERIEGVAAIGRHLGRHGTRPDA